jgi:hypothetical protein
MNRIITPVFRHQIESVCEKFFRPEFVAEELGQAGRWLVAVNGEGRSGCVRADNFKHNLTSIGQEGFGPRHPVAWHIHLHSGEVATTLWALGEKELRLNIERFHEKATYTAMAYLAYRLSNVGVWQNRKLQACVLATFFSGTTEQKSPNLHSDSFLMNAAHDPLKGPTAFSKAKVFNEGVWAKKLYEMSMGDALAGELGHFDRVARHMINANAFHISNVKHRETSATLVGRGPEVIFEAWKGEAAAQGFGM